MITGNGVQIYQNIKKKMINIDNTGNIDGNTQNMSSGVSLKECTLSNKEIEGSKRGFLFNTHCCQ